MVLSGMLADLQHEGLCRTERLWKLFDLLTLTGNVFWKYQITCKLPEPSDITTSSTVCFPDHFLPHFPTPLLNQILCQELMPQKRVSWLYCLLACHINPLYALAFSGSGRFMAHLAESSGGNRRGFHTWRGHMWTQAGSLHFFRQEGGMARQLRALVN